MDSCRAAELLRGQGYTVTALYMDMYGDAEQAANARRAAEDLGIPFRAADLRGRFRREVTDYFKAEYLAGRTPAPCTVCNREIKWRTLHETAVREGFDHIATGHYFNIGREGGRYYVSVAADPVKDQSYYLWPLSQEILAMALSPMGGQIKEDIRRSLASPPRESMGVCFLRGRNYADFLRQECGETVREGDIVDRTGRVVGTHGGIPYHTIGQKRGLPAGMCVTGIDAARNRISAGCDADLYHRLLIVSGCNIVSMDEVFSARDITVKVRGLGRNPLQPCTVSAHPKGLRITLTDPAWAPAAGQPVVLYRGGRVVGGGILEEYYPE